MWAGMDYLGEVGVGSWEYKDYAPDFSHGPGWITAGSGRIDLTGKPLAEAGYTKTAFELTDRPVMASHSDIREVWDAPRNLQKVHLKELISRKGIIGMNFFASFVGEKPQISDLLKHMDAVLEMGGEDCLAIGSDFDGCDGLFPTHIEGVQSMPFLREELLKHGFTEELTEKIFYKNAHRFVMENVK